MEKFFDSISICLSKGLGAPVGSVLLASEKFIHNSKELEKFWRRHEASWLSCCCSNIYALDNNITRLSEDHSRAKIIYGTLNNSKYVD